MTLGATDGIGPDDEGIKLRMELSYEF